MKRTPWVVAVAALLVASMSASGPGHVLVRVITGPPITYYSASVNPGAARPGDVVTATYVAHRARGCRATIHRNWFAEGGARLLKEPDLRGNYSRVTPKPAPIKVALTVPELPPGRFCYRATVESECDDGTWSATTPDVCLTVLSR